MSISGIFSNAMSGLTAASRAADVVSSNVANALNTNYARREINLSARAYGSGGVTVDSVTRVVDLALLADRRDAQAAEADQSARATFLDEVEMAIGQPGEAGSLADWISEMEGALIEAAARPEAEQLLNAVLRAATGVVNQINEISDRIQGLRETADTAIATGVETVNDALAKIHTLNGHITNYRANGLDSTGLEDQRQAEVDRIAKVMPVREVVRENGKVAIFSVGGAVLLDILPVTLGFTGTSVITEDMTLAGGSLSGLTISGISVTTSGSYNPIAGGSLEANFAVRDSLAIAAQADLEALARDLVERFQATAADTTRAATDPALFTDNGALFDAANEAGLSQRLKINTLVDPDQGGALWRIRDGLGATVQRSGGYADGLLALKDALTGLRTPVSGSFMGGARTFTALAADYLSMISTDSQAVQADLSYASARADALETLEFENGVDTDFEMQQLLLIEQAYSANARVIQAADAMIQTILEL